MSEKCILAASVALLACHPRTSINCFNSKQPTNPQNQTSYPPNPQNQSKSKKLRDHFDEEPTRSKLDIPSPLAASVPALNSISLLDQDHALFDEVKNSFVQGWDSASSVHPEIKCVYMYNNGVEAQGEFEEYREIVKFKGIKNKTRKKKLVFDGNEILGFHGSIVTCSFGKNEVSRFCEKNCCWFCRMMMMEKEEVWFNDCGWRAHQRLTRERAKNPVQGREVIVMCRVIAGRVGRYGEMGSVGDGYDSAMRSADRDSYVGEELMVLDPRALLPSFIVLYEVK